MPTGYTSGVQDGKIVTLEQFVWTCARAFGAMVMMWDDSPDALIPEKFEPSDWNEVELKKAELELGKTILMSESEVAAAAEADYQTLRRGYEESKAEPAIQRQRYEAMLTKVEGWEPPTPDHIEMKKFMVSQLKVSIQWDCKMYDAPARVAPKVWHAARIKRLEADVQDHREHHAEELERTEKRNAWIAAVRDSFKREHATV